MTPPPLLELRDVAVSHRSGRDTFRLEVPSLVLPPGGRLALVGRSGSGKSTLLDLLALARAPDRAGRFVFRPGGQAHDVMAEWRGAGGLDRLRARHVGYVLQTGGLLPFLTVRANIELPARLAGRRPASDLPVRMGIADQLQRRPHALSVGQRQRAAVARALVHAPALVLADEPTSALDPALAERVLDLLLTQTQAAGAALVLATHDHDAVARLGLPVMSFAVAAAPDGAVSRAEAAACG